MREITVIGQDRRGFLAQVTGALRDRGVDIRAISARDVAGVGRIDLLVDEPDQALEVLEAAGLKPVAAEVVAIRLRDEPGALAGLARRLAALGVNLRSVTNLNRDDGWFHLALGLTPTPEVLKLLGDAVVET